MRSLWLCAIVLAAWPRIGSARGVFGDENQTIPLNNPPPGELRGYYVRMSPLNLLHAGFGMGMPLNPRPVVPDPTLETFGQAYYMIDLSEGVQFGWNRSGSPEKASLLLTPQLGYTLMADTARYVHLGRLGLGIGYGNNWAAIHYVPRFVAGTSAGQFTIGARQSITVSFIANLLTAEVGHQLLYTAPQIEHDLYFTISANVLLVIYVLSLMR